MLTYIDNSVRSAFLELAVTICQTCSRKYAEVKKIMAGKKALAKLVRKRFLKIAEKRFLENIDGHV